MRKRRTPTTISLLVVTAFLTCLGFGAAGYFLASLSNMVSDRFGPPTPNLGIVQRTRLTVQLLWSSESLSEPADAFGEQQPFEIKLGESVHSISTRLQDSGLIRDARLFRAYLRYAGLDTTLQAGEYRLSAAMTPIEIANQLQDATPSEVSLHILPGWRLEEIAASLPTSGLSFPPQAFLAIAEDPPKEHPLTTIIPVGSSLEGFMPPGEYRFDRETDVEQVIKTLLEAFSNQVSFELSSGFDNQGLDPFQAVTLASIVEKESVVTEEMPMIASVFYNRLAAGMRLDADSTVQYALGYNPVQETWWTNPLSSADLQIDSAYNTYLSPGLPPGPIANPTLNALRAVAYPAQTPYYYFRAACDDSGKHLFSETLQEHVDKGCP